jgi:hypothetical protein
MFVMDVTIGRLLMFDEPKKKEFQKFKPMSGSAFFER